ncbi:hypothetical protein FPV67DRAFT_1674919 [Lyophyllum atratum]|nr:hypothetical protein FPV67DRAFT_1674919 [Lyophyllum atratum]
MPLLYTPRPSIESVSSSNSCRSFVDLKERRVPPPLYINDSNLHSRNSQKPPVIEIIAPGPPRVESRLSSYSVDPESPAASTPESPAFRMPSEEEVRRRRHEKVMRMLGERVPAELVYRGPKIPNVTVFPDPPMDKDSEAAGRETTKNKLARRASSTLSSFPNLSSVTSTLLPIGHGRTKSRDLLEFSDSSPSATPTPLTFPRRNRSPAPIAPTGSTYRSHTHPRPETVYSPIIFSSALEGASAPGSFADTEAGVYGSTFTERQRREEVERAARLARRASLSTATFLPTSPMRDGFR